MIYIHIKLVLLYTYQCITCVYITLERYRFITHQPSDVHLRINIRTYMRGDLVRIYVCNIHIITQVYFGYNYPFSRDMFYKCSCIKVICL